MLCLIFLCDINIAIAKIPGIRLRMVAAAEKLIEAGEQSGLISYFNFPVGPLITTFFTSVSEHFP